MLTRALWRRSFTFFAFGAVVVVALNIETLAKKFGWDTFLSEGVDKAPDGWAWFFALLTSGAAFWGSLLIIVYAAGLWTERLIAWLNTPAKKEEYDIYEVANECVKIARLLRKALPLIDGKNRYTTAIQLDLWQVMHKLYVAGIFRSEFITYETSDDADHIASVLSEIADAIKNDRLGVARDIADECTQWDLKRVRTKFDGSES